MSSIGRDVQQVSKMSHKAQVQYYERRLLSHPSDISYAPENVKKDLPFAFRVSVQYPLTLSYFDKSLGSNKDLVLSAITHAPQYEDTPLFNNLVKYIDNSLKSSKKFVLEACLSNNSFASVLLLPLLKQTAGGRLDDCKSFVLDAFRLNAENGLNLSSHLINFLNTLNKKNASLSKDLNFVNQCVEIEPASYCCFNEDVRSDLMLAIKAIRKPIFSTFRSAPMAVLENKEFIKASIQSDLHTSMSYYLVVNDEVQATKKAFIDVIGSVGDVEWLSKFKATFMTNIASYDAKYKAALYLVADILLSKAPRETLITIKPCNEWLDEMVKNKISKKDIEAISIKSPDIPIKKRRSLKKIS